MEGDRMLPLPPSSNHRCKVCRKSFPSGRSLGGHMRSHVNVAANSSSDGDERQQSSYSLRENPKKTWRLSDSGGGGEGEMQCRECGKEFLSWTALFGHMRCHSDKTSEERGEHDGSCSNAGYESQSDSEAAAATAARRRGRSKWIGRASACSLSASKYETQDEDGAIGLMLLSRDVRHWSGSCCEASGKNSEVLESWDFVSNESDKKGSELGGSTNEFKKVESDASDDGIVRDDIDEFKKPKFYASSSDDFRNLDDEPSRLGFSKKDDLSYGVTELSMKPRFDGSDIELRKNSLSILGRFEAYDAKVGTDLVENSLPDVSDGFADKATKKRSRFECKACNKIFHSYQALGGHRASHKRMKGCPGQRIHGTENSMETDASAEETAMEECFGRDVSMETGCRSPKVNKGHQCLICSKFFSSGQALGGHKRSHLVANTGSGGDAACPIVIPQQKIKMPDLLDLNLPANGSDELKSWWLGGNLKHEPLIDVISN